MLSIPTVPRTVRWTWSGMLKIWLLRLFILPHVLVGAWLLVSTPWCIAVQIAGHDYPGLVRNIETTRKQRLRIEYSYSVDGAVFHGSDTLATTTPVRAGDPLAVRCFPRWPSLGAQLQWPGRGVGTLLLLAGICLFWNGCLIPFVWLSYIKPFRISRLLRWGEVARGRISGVRVVGGKGSCCRVNYEYDPAAHPFAIDQSSGPESCEYPAALSWADRLRAGDDLIVIYDADRPSRSVPYELCGDLFVVSAE